jgi:RNA polymerase sigma-70 factor (ECF subfamily)
VAESRVIIFDKGRRSAVDDAELVAALRAHDERAYTAAWVELGPMVRRLVTRFFGVGADTPDLSQEVFLRLFRRIDELRNPSGLRGFVVSICLGVARNELRRVRVRRWVRLTSSGEVPEAPTPGPDIEAREALRRLYAILDQVSVQDRSLFVARFFEKMEIAEVASAHGLSYGTAKRHVARATERINRRIEREPMLAKYLDMSVAERVVERRDTPVRASDVRDRRDTPDAQHLRDLENFRDTHGERDTRGDPSETVDPRDTRDTKEKT